MEREILTVEKQKLGETLLFSRAEKLTGFAVCHCGQGTEAGSGTCYIKFGGVQPSTTAGSDFDRLLHACEELALLRGMSRLVAGANMGRHEACQTMLRSGFKTDFLGVAMHRPSEPGYNGPNAYVIDYWRFLLGSRGKTTCVVWSKPFLGCLSPCASNRKFTAVLRLTSLALALPGEFLDNLGNPLASLNEHVDPLVFVRSVSIALGMVTTDSHGW